MKIELINGKTGMGEIKEVSLAMTSPEVMDRHHLSAAMEVLVAKDGEVIFPSDFGWCDGKVIAMSVEEFQNPLAVQFFGGAFLKQNVERWLFNG